LRWEPAAAIVSLAEIETLPEAIMPNETELGHLRRCIALAAEALEAGDSPFGSVLVAADGTVLAEARNRANSGEPTRHPEFDLARWAGENMTPADRAAATVFTSGEHCAMCCRARLGWARPHRVRGLDPAVCGVAG
jgi:tRNA(Arg) A34 adenosine deaminase TadA